MTLLLIVLVLLAGGLFYGYHYLKARALGVSWSDAVLDSLAAILRLK
jgi:hypothetical protein